MRYEFHSHSFLSDGDLHPLEHLRHAVHRSQGVVAVTDHVGVRDATRILPTLVGECQAAMDAWRITALPGVEITHVPPGLIPGVAKQARKLGARIVVVHGETASEPVAKGTNAAAVRCGEVDVLAHPGFLSQKDARAAVENGVLIELTGKRAHAATNGHVARLVERLDAPFLVDGDVHAPDQFLSEADALSVALGAGLPKALAHKGLSQHPRELLRRRA